MPRPKDSDLIRLNDISPLVYEMTGQKRCRATIYNWGKNGRRVSGGRRLKLVVYDKLGKLYTTKQQLLTFIAAIG